MTTFEGDIKPLFREYDRLDMLFHLDLWQYDDVRREAENIYTRLSDRTMPCDLPWSPENISKFRDWIDSGLKER